MNLSDLQGFWVQSILAVTTWRDLAAQPVEDTRSDFFSPSICPWQHATSSNDNCSSAYGIQAGICGLYSFSINRISHSFSLLKGRQERCYHFHSILSEQAHKCWIVCPTARLMENCTWYWVCWLWSVQGRPCAITVPPCSCGLQHSVLMWPKIHFSGHEVKEACPRQPNPPWPSKCQREPWEAEWWWAPQHWTLALGLEFELSHLRLYLWALWAYKTSCCILHGSWDWDWWCCGKARVWSRLNLSEHSRGFSTSSAVGISSTGPHCYWKCHQSVNKYFLRQQCENSTRSPKWQVRKAAWCRGETGL